MHPDDVVPSKNYAFVQWKGTDLCADAHCECGARVHVCGDFMYFINCANCGKAYYMGSYVKLYEVTDPADLKRAKEDYEYTMVLGE